MCYQVTELYSSCRCLYYQHAVDQCPRHLHPSHKVTHRYIIVGYTCEIHSSVVAVGEDADFEYMYFSRAAVFSESHDSKPRSTGLASSAKRRLLNDNAGRTIPRHAVVPLTPASPVHSYSGASNVTEIGKSIYQNSPLENGQIRLLEICPSEERQGSDLIRINMFSVFLDDDLKYDALSYRWECSTGHRYIFVNGVRTPVMENLFCALKEIRSAFASQNSPTSQNLWVDSICIDQASIEERTKQVGLMGQIYSNASIVRVWIGSPGSTNVRAAFDFIEDTSRLENVYPMTVGNTSSGIKAITELLDRSYWNRMWVFQEIVLAQEAVVHCGAHSIPWEQFKRFDAVCRSRATWNITGVQHEEFLELRNAQFKIAHLFVSRAQATHVRNVLLPTRHLQCQDPKDKLYALLGVCDTLAKTTKPNYALSTRDAYVDFSKKRIRADGDLSSLLTAGAWTPARGNDIGLPSWVPDLRSMEGVDIRFVVGATLERFNAAEPTHAAVRFVDSESDCIMETQAYLADTLLAHQDLQRTRDEGWEELINNFCLIGKDSILSLPKLRYFFQAMVFEDASFFGQENDSLIDKEIARGVWKGVTDMMNSVTASRSTGHVKLIQERALMGLISGFYEELKRHFSHQIGSLVGFWELFKDRGVDFWDHLQRVRLDTDNRHMHWQEFLARTDETTDKGNSAIFSTRHGRIGTGPRNARTDDYVALLRGCRVPLILRQDGCHFKLVGPCYVSGLMQGEVFSGCKEKDSSFFQEVHIV